MNNDVLFELTPVMQRYAEAVKAFGWDNGSGYGYTGILYGIDLALRHPEWARALQQEAIAYVAANDGAIHHINDNLDEFVSRVPIHLPGTEEGEGQG